MTAQVYVPNLAGRIERHPGLMMGFFESRKAAYLAFVDRRAILR